MEIKPNQFHLFPKWRKLYTLPNYNSRNGFAYGHEVQDFEVCINKTDNTGISEFVGGQVIVSAIDNPLQSDSPYNDEPLAILALNMLPHPFLG